MLNRDFLHVPNFTGYMGVIFEMIQSGRPGQKILDIPAGQGVLAARLRECGHQVHCADIDRTRPGCVYADMNEPLPFQDAEFDLCLCMEGIEHVLDPTLLIRELCRVTRPGGRIILSLPNIQNAYSRFNFLCAGYFFQFSPDMGRHLPAGRPINRGHISPLTYLQLRYLFEHYGARLVSVRGDRWKKKWLIPFLLPFFALGWLWGRIEPARPAQGAQGAEPRKTPPTPFPKRPLRPLAHPGLRPPARTMTDPSPDPKSEAQNPKWQKNGGRKIAAKWMLFMFLPPFFCHFRISFRSAASYPEAAPQGSGTLGLLALPLPDTRGAGWACLRCVRRRA